MNGTTRLGAMELAALADITYKQLDTWTKNDWVKEEPRPSGTGHHRAYRATEVRIAQIMGVLVNAGVAAPVAARAARSAILEVDTRGPLFMSELARGVAVTGRIP
jgi:hypothetical protein